jgi:hypothetical protein
MGEIKRYDPESFGNDGAYLTEDAQGDVVKYDDYAAAIAAQDGQIARQAVVIEKYRQAQEGEWHPISTCPYRDPVDLWCVYGGEEFAQFDGGASIGFLISNQFKTEKYGFFGNQSNDGVPRRDGPDLKPVAWRRAVPSCPATLIAEALGIPLTREDAIAALTQPDAKSGEE